MEPRNAFKGRYYQILNVHPEATLEDIRNSYKKLCKIYHPDRHLDQQAKQAAQVCHGDYDGGDDVVGQLLTAKSSIRSADRCWQACYL